MEQLEETVTPCLVERTNSPERYLATLSARFADRGLAKAVRNSAEEQIKKEEQTRQLAPEAYRLSTLNEATLIGCYRRGKDTMSSADLVRYVSETRREALKSADLSANLGIDECRENILQTALVPLEKKKTAALPTEIKNRALTTCRRIKGAFPTWFDSRKPDASAERRRFPVSAFAAIAAVAVSMMLIVASSVMVTRAEDDLSRLKVEISESSQEVFKLKSDFESQNDLLKIREIAMEEYGMVEEEYVRMNYMSQHSEDSVETFEEEREERMSLSALLSAIGIK